MRIVDRKAFLAMPDGTVFSMYDQSIIREPKVKTKSLGSEGEMADFCFTSLTDGVDCEWSERDDIINLAEIEGTHFALSFNTQCRDGDFAPHQHFAVWGRKDVEGLIARLQQTLADAYTIATAPADSLPGVCPRK